MSQKEYSWFLIFVLLLLYPVRSVIPSDGQTRLLTEIRRLESEYGGHLGVMAKNLKTGEVVAYNASERFPTASAIKFPVMAAFFHLVDLKQVDPNLRVELSKDDRKQGSGILQFLSEGTTITLLDAVKLMTILSDNTATNLVLDRLASTHASRLSTVNDFISDKGLKNTRILNRLYSVSTKLRTPEAIRYGIGVSTPEDMVSLMSALYSKTLVTPSSCDSMLEILKQQMYRDMIPRFLPEEDCKFLDVANKTGSIDESKVDVGLILSDKADVAMAIFIDKHPDHREILDSRATLLGACVSRAIWNHFTGSTGYKRRIPAHAVDWNTIPGGRWAIYRSSAAPFPHKSRMDGFKAADGAYFPYFPHYADNSIVVVVPEGFKETDDGVNLIIHFHGHLNDNLGVLEQYGMVQSLFDQKVNALLVLPQGPYRARDSSGGKMEEDGGFQALVEDVLSTFKNEGILKAARLNKIVLSAHSGGYRTAAFVLERGRLDKNITEVFLFDAFYGQQEYFRNWLNKGTGVLHAAYTDHLAKEHIGFEKEIRGEALKRVSFTHTSIDHDEVIQQFFSAWLAQLDDSWKTGK